MAMRMQLAEVLTNREKSVLWDLTRQLGVTQVVTGIADGPDLAPAWDFDRLKGIKETFAAEGLDVTVIESAPASIQEPIKLGLGDRDEHIDHFCQLIENMGRLDIPIMCHNWMAGIGWLRKSAERGFARAQFALALLHEKGEHVARSQDEATAWYRKAAEQNHLEAQVGLATQYFLGRGAPRDYTLAAQWYERAAEQGDEASAYIVASLYEKGEGVAQNNQLAWYWYSRAANGGEPAAIMKAREMRDKLPR